MGKIKYIKRDLESSLKKVLSSAPVVVITGARQTGKSTLLINSLKKKYKLISFDDLTVRQEAIKNPKMFFEKCGDFVIFDEIQHVPELLSYIKILVDEDRSKKGRFILTGSQQFNLMKNIGDTLAGRVAILRLYPFSLNEKKKKISLKASLSTSQNEFISACLQGSYPEMVVDSSVDRESWYSSYIQTYLERDVRSLYNVGSLREFEQFLGLLASRTAQVLNLSGLSRDIGVSVNTVKSWISILEASHIIYLLSPYYQNFGKRITKNPKIYFMDIGLVSYLLRLESEKQIMQSSMAGSLFENFIIQETVKYYFHQGKIPKLYYMRTHNNVEVDLIVEQQMKLYPFEIKLTKTPSPEMAKSIESITEIFGKLDFQKGQIICLSDNMMKLSKNVSVTNSDKFLYFLNTI